MSENSKHSFSYNAKQYSFSHLHITSIPLGFHLDITSSSLRYHFDFTLISPPHVLRFASELVGKGSAEFGLNLNLCEPLAKGSNLVPLWSILLSKTSMGTLETLICHDVVFLESHPRI